MHLANHREALGVVKNTETYLPHDRHAILSRSPEIRGALFRPYIAYGILIKEAHGNYGSAFLRLG